MREVVLFQQRHHLGDRHLSLGRHQLAPLFRQRGVHRDGHVALALVEETLQLRFHAYAADGDAPRTPGVAVVGRQDLRGPKHGVEVIHRFALAHEDNVRQALALGQGVDLVQDIGRGQVALEALLARLTEEAVHLAAHLARDAERGPLAIGDEDGLYEEARRVCCCGTATYGEQVLDGAVAGALAVDGSHRTHNIPLLQPLAVRLREIGHLVDGRHVLLIEPLEYLPGRESGHPQVEDELLHFAKRKPK